MILAYIVKETNKGSQGVEFIHLVQNLVMLRVLF